MLENTMSRRSFVKVAAVTGAIGTLGVAAADNMVNSDKAWADDDVEEVRTSCRACIANCGCIATVSNGRVIKLRGDDIDPMSKGRLCPKGLSGIQALYHPNRNKYPLKRVGDKPGNEWERISWEEAANTVAQAMIDMRDKTGKHGLLTTTGGGGNPQFFSPPRFRNFWGGGNVFEPGCAQCYLPRNYTMSKINGIGDTSIADSGCSELYKPAGHDNWGHMCDVYVMWGTGPAWHSPSTSGRCVVEMRAYGCKTIVVDPRFNADATKADVWLPIKPGTDLAMMLGWMNYIISNKLYEQIPDYEDFCAKWTNLPFLVDSRDEMSLPYIDGERLNITGDGQLLRASQVKDIDVSAGEGYVYYDSKTQKVTKAFALSPDNEDSYNPELFGTFDVELADGTTIQCKTAFQAYWDRCEEWTLEKTAEVTGVPAELIQEAVELYCSSAHGGISLGVATDMYPGSVQAAIGAAALDCMTAHLAHGGCPASSVGTGRAAESTIFPSGFMGDTAYNFQESSAVLERLGYSEHKALGSWMHSHIPTVLSAVLTGEPYQPKVWIERSGNKMAALGNSSSWVDAFPNFDMIVHGYMYPTSFSTEAADVIFPVCEWLENAFVQGRLNVTLLRKPVVNLFEAADEIMMWGKIAEAMSDPSSDLYDPNMEACMSDEMIGSPMVPAYWKTINEYWDWVATQLGVAEITTMEQAWDATPFVATEDEAYWGGTVYDSYAVASEPTDMMGNPTGEPAVYAGFSTDAADIVDSPKKCGPYADQMTYIGRHGTESFEMPASVIDWNPMPYYFTPQDETHYGDDYPLTLTEGRIPYYHHGTLRNNPYLRELYPAPEIWISPENAEEYGISDGDWVNVHSPRTDGLDVFRNITSGIDVASTIAPGVEAENTEFNPGEELTANGQSVVADGIYVVARVTEGIARDSVYLERFWNPEFLEEGQDARKSWTTSNMNVLTKNTGYFNPEIGTYTLRGIRVRVEKASKPEGIWYDAEDFKPWMAEPSDSTGGGCYES